MNWLGSFSKAAASVAVVLSLGVSSASAAPEAYDVDAVHSTVLFRVQHMKAGYVYGRFNELSGKLVLDEANPSASSIQVEVKAASVDTNDKKRDEHLRTADFFDVAQFPALTFKSTSVKASGSKFDVTGDLTMHGVTKSVTVAMEKTGAGADPWGFIRVGFEGTLTVKRTDFGMDKMLEGVGDEIRVTLAFEGARKK